MAMVEEVGHDVEFSELLGFLQDPKPEVKQMAAEGVLSYTENTDFLDYCRLHPRKCAKPLLRLMEKAEADIAENAAAYQAAADIGTGEKAKKAAELAGKEIREGIETGGFALKAIVNLSAIPSVRDELVELNAPRRCAEALRAGWLEGRANLTHWYAMLLSNITTTTAGQEAICADEPLLRFIFAAYIAKPRPPARDGYDDVLGCLGKVLGNVFALPKGRKLIAAGEGGPSTICTLVAELGDRSRRADVLAALRNLCLDKDCHETLVHTDIFHRVAQFVYPLDKVDVDHQAKLPQQLREDLVANGAVLSGDGQVRYATALCIVGLCRTTEGRKYLRGQGCEEVLRAWRLEEHDEETTPTLDTAIGSLAASDEEQDEPPATSSLDDVDGN